MKTTIEKLAQAVADGLNELGYGVEVPNEKGEMLFGPECHEVQTILNKVFAAMEYEIDTEKLELLKHEF